MPSARQKLKVLDGVGDHGVDGIGGLEQSLGVDGPRDRLPRLNESCLHCAGFEGGPILPDLESSTRRFETK